MSVLQIKHFVDDETEETLVISPGEFFCGFQVKADDGIVVLPRNVVRQLRNALNEYLGE